MLIDFLWENKFISFPVKLERPGWSRAKGSFEAPRVSMLHKKLKLKLRAFLHESNVSDVQCLKPNGIPGD